MIGCFPLRITESGSNLNTGSRSLGFSNVYTPSPNTRGRGWASRYASGSSDVPEGVFGLNQRLERVRHSSSPCRSGKNFNKEATREDSQLPDDGALSSSIVRFRRWPGRRGPFYRGAFGMFALRIDNHDSPHLWLAGGYQPFFHVFQSSSQRPCHRGRPEYATGADRPAIPRTSIALLAPANLQTRPRP